MYRLPKINLYKTQMEKIRQKNYKVVIFGNGLLGKGIVDLLLEDNVEIIEIFDNNKQINGTEYRGIPVTLPHKIMTEETVVIVSVYQYRKNITNQLIELGYKKIFPYYCCFNGQTVSEEFYWNNEPSIQEAEFFERCDMMLEKEDFLAMNVVELAVTEKCSLKCNYCANLIPYYTNPMHEDTNKNVMAFKRLLKCVDLIGNVNILGGEPLLNNEVPVYVSTCIESNEIMKITVVTNGTIPVKEELVTELKKDNRCVLSISNYGDLSRRKEEIIALSEKEKFNVVLARKDGLWTKKGRIEYKELTENELEEKYKICTMKKCITIKDGKLFVCSFVAHAYSLGAVAEKDLKYIDLLDEKVSDNQLKEDIKKFISKKSHTECKYCIEMGNKAEIVPVAEQLTEIMTYKKYNS